MRWYVLAAVLAAAAVLVVVFWPTLALWYGVAPSGWLGVVALGLMASGWLVWRGRVRGS